MPNAECRIPNAREGGRPEQGSACGPSERPEGSAAERRPRARARGGGASRALINAGRLSELLRCSLVLAALFVSQACGGGSERPRAQFLSIATGGTGGVYYPYGGGIAKVLSESLPGIRATAEVTAASVDNLKLIRDGKADLAFTLADTAADAANGRGAFQGAPAPVATLAVLYSNYTHLVALAASGITSVESLRGKTVSTGSPGSGTEVIAFRILRAAGLDPDADVRRQGLGASESAGALKDGKVDAFFWSGGLPTAAVQDLAHSSGISLTFVPTGALVAALQGQHGALYFPLEIPAGSYPGVTAAVPVVGVANLLVANRSMPEQLAYDITRVIFEKQAELAGIHPEARNLSVDTATKGSPIELHAGAARYYQERGIRP
jgi:TRAP transporter TAXI family solute receptor